MHERHRLGQFSDSQVYNDDHMKGIQLYIMNMKCYLLVNVYCCICVCV